VAVFNGTCSSNCSPTISADINVAGVRITSSYAGTITQNAGVNITLGASGWSQIGGTFAGGNSTVSLSGPFVLAGGSYTATSGTTSVGGNWSVFNSPTFSGHSGLLYFGSSSIIIPGSVHYSNATFGGFLGSFNLSGGTMYIDGALNLNSTSASPPSYLDSGTLMVGGDVTASNYGVFGNAVIQLTGKVTGQTVTGVSTAAVPSLVIATGTNNVTLSGSLPLAGLTVTSVGTLTTTGSTLSFSSSAVITPGTAHYNNVTFGGYTANFSLGGATMYIDGSLSLNSTTSSPTSNIDSGTLMVGGDVTASNYGMIGSATIQLTGKVTGQTVTGISTSSFPSLVIATGTNNVTLSGSLSLAGLTVTSVGTLTTTGSTLIFSSSAVITPGTAHYNNVTFGGFVASFSLGGGTMNIDGTLTLTSTSLSPPSSLDSGTLALAGNLTTANYGVIGNAQLKFKGATNQTATLAGGTSLPTGNVTLALTGGASLILGANLTAWNNAGQTVSATSGNINMAGYALTSNSLSLNGNTVTKNGGVLTVNGSVAGTGSLFGGTVAP
jgi:hypothetical protein